MTLKHLSAEIISIHVNEILAENDCQEYEITVERAEELKRDLPETTVDGLAIWIAS